MHHSSHEARLGSFRAWAGLRRLAVLLFAALGLAATTLTVAPPNAEAQDAPPPPPNPSACYAVADETQAGASTADGLALIDRFTGLPTFIGLTGTSFIEAIAFAPGTILDPAYNYQVLYAFNGTDFGWINLQTGAFTSLGVIPGTTDIDGMTWDPVRQIFWLTDRIAGAAPDIVLAYDPFTNMIVAGPWATGIADPADPDPEAAEFVTAAGAPYSEFDDIAISPVTGQLFAILNGPGGNGGGLVELDPNTGAIIDYVGLFDIPAGGVDFDGNGIVDDMEGIAFFNDGTLYGTTGDNGAGQDLNRFWTIDPATGETVLVGSFGGQDYIDYEALGCYVAAATIDVEKATEGDDADVAPGPLVTTPDVTWTYVITNTSAASSLTSIVLVDDVEGLIYNQDTGFSRCAEGNLGLPPGAMLAAGAQVTCTVTGVTQPGQYQNEATVTGVFDPGNLLDPIVVTDLDPSHYFGGASELAVVKTVVVGDPVNCNDVPPELGNDLELVNVGDTVTFCVTVSNTGTAPATNVTVVDNQFTPLNPLDDFPVPGLIGIDLGPGESATSGFTYVVNDQTPLTNTVTAGGTDGVTGEPTNQPTDPSSIQPPQGNAALSIVKTVVVDDLASCDGVLPEPGDDEELVNVGDTVTFCITVTNTGDGPATDVDVVDDNFTPADPGDDVLLLDGIDLAAGESATVLFTYDVSDQTPLENTATATGTDVNSGGDPLGPVSDPSSILPPQGNANLIIVKTAVLGADANCDDAPQLFGDDTLTGLALGDDVTFCIVVTNNGDGPATDVDVVDDNFTPADPGDDVLLLDGIDLAAGQSATTQFNYTVSNLDQLENTATATGTDVNSGGDPLGPVSDPSSIAPEGTAVIAVVKTAVVGDNVNCDDVLAEPGNDQEPVVVGDTVTFCVTVSNIGDAPATNVTVSDDNFTPADPADDFDIAGLVGLDLDVGEAATGSFTYVVADQSQLTNTVTATGTDLFNQIPTNEPSDPSTILPPQGNAQIAVVKTVVLGDNIACEAVPPQLGDDEIMVELDDVVTFCVTVTNVGNGPASNVQVIDDNFTPAVVADDFTVIAPTDLAPGQSATGSFTHVVSTLDPLENTVTASGTDVFGNVPTNEPSDPSSILPEGDPILDVIKTVVVGDPVDCETVDPERGDDLELVNVGDTVTFCITVSNTGNAPAVDVNVIDDNFTPGDTADDFFVMSLADLAHGQSVTGSFTYQVTDQTPLENTVTATGTDPFTGNPTNEPSDPSSIQPPQGNAEIAVVKTVVLGDDINCAFVPPLTGDDEIIVEIGDTVTFCVTVANVGNGPAADVTVTDDNFTPADAGDDEIVIGPIDLAVGESSTTSYTYDVVDLTDLENTVVATGIDVNAGGVPTNEPSDPSSIDAQGEPVLSVVKTAVLGDDVNCDAATPRPGDDELDVAVFDTVTYCIVVTNVGNAPAVDVTVVDDNFTPADTADDVTVIASTDLDIGESATGSFTYVVADQTPLENTVTASGTDPETGGPTNEPSDPASILPPQGSPELAVVKTVVEGADADCSDVTPRTGDDTLAVEIGDSVTYCIVVENVGAQPAIDVTVVDDNFTPDDTSDDFVVIDPVDLDPGESAEGQFSFVVTELGALENTVTATGTDANTLEPTNEPTDPASIVPFGTPILDVIKTAVIGDDVDCDSVDAAPGLDEIVAEIGDTVTFCITVTNTGDGPATDVSVVDNNFTPADTSDDITVIDSVDLDENGGSATGSISVVVTDDDGLVNVVTATGTDPVTGDPTNEPEDPSGVITPSVELAKQVLRGADADCSTAVEGLDELVIGDEGDPLTWCFTVTNTGSTYLSVSEVNDSVLGITIPIPAGSQLLAPGASVTVSATGSISEAGLQNTGTVDAQPVDPETGDPLPDPETGDPVSPVSDDDTAAEGPARIEITKQVLRGADRECSIASEGVHEQVVGSVGDAITWCFTITNTGVSSLTNVLFSDAVLDIAALDVLAQNGLVVLAPGQSVSFAANSTIPDGGVVNTAVVTATPSGPNGDPNDPSVVGADPVTDNNDAQVDEASIELEKMVLLGADADCSTAVNGVDELVKADVDDAITWCFRVINTGSVPLEVTEVVDETLDLTVAVPAELQIVFPGESIEVSAAGTVPEDDFANVASASGTPLDPELEPIIDPETGQPPTPPEDDDTAGTNPAIANLSLTKTNDLPDDATRVPGSVLDYTVTVTNQGPDPAADVVMEDRLPVGMTVRTAPSVAGWDCDVNAERNVITCTIDELDVGESVEFTYEAQISLRPPTNVALVNVAEVESTTFDNDPSDNRDDDQITVPVVSLITPVEPADPPPPDEVQGIVEVPLAVTGSSSIVLVAIGNLALMLGGLFLIVGRRRRDDERDE